ncbi:MAG: hypothetical protein MZU91_07485 [Desulfosudis oleivorans]|nr:hypothetical protein [Desulfosudis oleivorans]
MSNHVAFGNAHRCAALREAGRQAFHAGTHAAALRIEEPAGQHHATWLSWIRPTSPTISPSTSRWSPRPMIPVRRSVNDMFSYVKTYFELGGMQMQMNVVTSETLRDAMAHPENYRNLLVRISGYNAYFVTLNRDMQLELIERAEYGI